MPAVAEPGAPDAGTPGQAPPRGRGRGARARVPPTRRVVVVPLYDDRRLRYQDWVAGRRAAVRARSDGRVGYLHVPDMMGEAGRTCTATCAPRWAATR